nr:nucleoside triphosphate pyrophosphatase [Micromonospora sp. NBRC 107566]
MLASASPARRALLAAAGIDCETVVSGVDESAVSASGPEALCLVLARMKAQAVAGRLRSAGDAAPEVLVVGCDSVLGFDGETLGKPVDAADAVRRWRAMRGRSGVLYTGHHLVQPATGKQAEGVAATVVHFADLTDAEIDAYVATGEPLAVAGAFTIDGIGGAFLERIEGDHGTVVGLSLPLLRSLLGELGLSIVSLWR